MAPITAERREVGPPAGNRRAEEARERRRRFPEDMRLRSRTVRWLIVMWACWLSMVGALTLVIVLRPGLINAIKARMHAPYVRSFQGGLRLQVPRGWIADDTHICYWSFLGGVRSQLSIYPMAESGKFAAPGEIESWKWVVVGGLDASLERQDLQVVGGEQVLVYLSIRGRDVFITFSGTERDWDFWLNRIDGALREKHSGKSPHDSTAGYSIWDADNVRASYASEETRNQGCRAVSGARCGYG